MAKKLVVVGGVAAGMSAAAKAKRTDPEIEVVAFERNGFTSYGACGMPYVLEGLIPRMTSLVVRSPEQHAKHGLKALVHHEVTQIDYEGRRVEIYALREGRSFFERFDQLVIATGATPVRPRLDGIDQEGIFVLRSMEDGMAIAEALGSVTRTAIVGGGYIGLELAEAFRARGKDVTLIEATARVMPQADPEVGDLVRAELERHGVRVATGAAVQGFGGSGRVESVETAGGVVPAGLVVLAMGIRPSTDLAASIGARIGPTGAVAVDERLATSLPAVWAAGDCAESRHLVTGEPFWLPLGDVANKHGRVAGTNLAGGRATFAGVTGTTVTKVFDLGVATTGLSERAARSRGLEVDSVWVTSEDRARYYPGAGPLHVKLVWRRADGRLVGAQVAGQPGAVKRIDVVSALLGKGGTIEDLASADLAYAPPFSPVWDPLLVAANQAVRT